MNMCEVYGMTMNDMGVPDTPTLSRIPVRNISNNKFGMTFWAPMILMDPPSSCRSARLLRGGAA